MARVKKVDEIVVEDPRVFENTAKILLRDDGVIELYAVAPDSLEHYVGQLNHHTTGDLEKIKRLVVAIRAVVKKNPFSIRSYLWLRALNQGGLLTIWEPILA